MNKILIIGICLILFSCGDDSKSEYEIRKEKRQIKEQIREEQISKLTKENNIQFCWDTLDLKYSILYEPVLKSKYQLIRNPEILDVFKSDSTFNIRASCGFYPTYYFTLYTSNEVQVNQIIDKKNDEDYDSDFLFVVSIENIKRGLFEVNAIPEGEEDAYIELESSDNYYGKGKIKQIKMIK